MSRREGRADLYGMERRMTMKRWIAFLTAIVMLITCCPLYGMASTTSQDYLLESFDSNFDTTKMSPNQTNFGVPIFSVTTENTEDGDEGMKVEWGTTLSNGTEGSALFHQMPTTAEWSTTTFAQQADNYDYLRFWFSNPTGKELHVMTRLFSANTKVHFKADHAVVTNSSGVVMNAEYGNETTNYELGCYTTLHIPAEFEGWIAYPIDRVEHTSPAGSSRPPISSYSEVTQIEFDIRLTRETTTVGYYYVLDNLTLSDLASGTPKTPVTPPPTTDTLMLEDFSDYTDFTELNPINNGYATPTFELTESGVDEGTALRVNWASTETLKSYVHQLVPTSQWATQDFATNAGNYSYLRFWVNNPTFITLDLTIKLRGNNTESYLNGNNAIVSRKDGTQITHVAGNASGLGSNSSIEIPSAFSGWVAYPLDLGAVSSANSQNGITSFSEVCNIEIDVRRPETSDTGSYYILDNICLSTEKVGTLQSLGDSSYDTTDGQPFETELKNVIVLVGDGMGQTILQATRDYTGKALNMDSMQYQSNAISSNNVYEELTDSSAAGTALSCGVRTVNGHIGLDQNGNAVENMVEFFSRANKKTGLVTTSYLLDATPTTCGSRGNRGSYANLADGLFKNNISVLLGGGTDYFNSRIDYAGTKYTVLDYAQTVHNYTYVKNADELRAFEGEKVLGVFGSNYMSYEMDRDSSQMPIDEMTEKAISLLENDEGFFLMVEGGNIDHAAHDNDFNRTITDTIAFDNAVQVALDYMAKNPDTLVVVCADHSTGGLTKSGNGYIFTTNNHDMSKTACFASGLGSEYFVELKENADIAHAIRKATFEVESSGIIATCDKTKLNRAIEKAKALKESDYTADSFAALQSALSKAEKVANNTAVTQEVVDKTTEELSLAIDKLVKRSIMNYVSPITGDGNCIWVLFAIVLISGIGTSVAKANNRKREV